MQQLLPPPVHRAPHMACASPAQIESQATVQQNESAAQTVASQASSSQPSPPLAKQQLLAPEQIVLASLTQIASQATEQQNGSTAQVALQQASSEQNGVPTGVKQSF